MSRPKMVILLALFLGSVIFRLIGAGWGLPNADRNFSLHPDEYPNLAYSRQIEPAAGKFTPGFYNYGTLYFTMLRVAGDVALTYAGKESDAPNKFTPKDQTTIHMAGRILNVVFGSLVPVVAFLLLAGIRRRDEDTFGNLAAPALGALSLAVAPALAVHSRFQSVDMLAMVTLAASLYYSCKLLAPADTREDAAPKDDFLKLAVLSGVFAGLSAGTKYTGAVALVPLFVALFLRNRKQFVIPSLAGTFACILAFIVTTPGVLLEQAQFLKDLAFEMDHTKTGHGLVFAATSPAAIYHIGNIGLGFGFLAGLLGLVGLGLAVKQKEPWAWVVISFFLIYYLVIARAEIKFMRYVIPAFFPLGIGVGYLVQWAKDNIEVGFKQRAWIALVLLAIGGIDKGGLTGSANFTLAMATEDPRDSAGKYLKQVGVGKTVGVALDPWFWTPTLYPDVPAPRFVSIAKREDMRKAAVDPMVLQYMPDGQPEGRFDWDVRLLKELKPDFVTLTSLEFAYLDRLGQSQKRSPEEDLVFGRYKEFTTELKQGYELDRAFLRSTTPYVEDMEYVSPQVYVWKKKP